MSRGTIRKKSFFIFGWVLFVIGLDQGTKQAVMWLFGREGSPIYVMSTLSLVSVWNQGVSFGFLGQDQVSPMVLTVFALILCGCLLLWAYREKESICAFGLALVLGGALSNVIDRYRYKAVFDFIDCHWGSYHWPAFNVADSLIVVGVVILFWKVLFKK